MSDSYVVQLPIAPDRKKRFKGLDEVKSWLQNEREEYAWLTSKRDWNYNRIDDLRGKVSQAYSELDQVVEWCIDEKEKNEDVNGQGRLRNKFRSFYVAKGLLSTESSDGKYVESLRKEDEEYAALVYSHLSDLAYRRQNKDRRAAFEAFKRKTELDETLENEKQSLKHLKNEWDTKYGEHLAERKEEVESLHSAARQKIDKLKNEFSKGVAQAEAKAEEFGKLLSESSDDLDEIRETYQEQIALLAPVEYWKNKAWWHLAASITWGIATLIAGIVVGVLFVQEADIVLGPERRPNYAQVIVLLTIATLGIWGLRLLVRLLFSQIHLFNDARERSVMLQSFLALLREGHIEQQEKEAILNTLFRPGMNEVAKNDNAPMGAAEVLSRFGMK